MTKKTRATFLSALATLINDNTTLDVSPADVRDAFTDLADSAAFIDDELEVEANNQTGTSYTLVLDDAWKQVRMDNAGANTLTVPPNASVAFETGTVVWVEQAGAGTTSVAAGAGVTINTPDDLALVENQTVRLLKVGTDEWTMTDAAPTAGGGGVSALNDLSDVDTATNGVVAKDFLVHDGANFVPRQSNVIGKHAVVADDGVETLTLPGDVQAGILMVNTFLSTSPAGIFRFNAKAGELYISAMVSSGTPSLLTSTSVLTGTTGTDGRITVSVNNGTVYVENRSGGATRLDFSVIQNQSF